MLHRVLAEAPIAYEAYLETFRLFTEASSLTPLEQQIVMMTVNVTNECHYCTAGHTMLLNMIKAPEAVTEALRAGQDLEDPRQFALQTFHPTASGVARACGRCGAWGVPGRGVHQGAGAGGAGRDRNEDDFEFHQCAGAHRD